MSKRCSGLLFATESFAATSFAAPSLAEPSFAAAVAAPASTAAAPFWPESFCAISFGISFATAAAGLVAIMMTIVRTAATKGDFSNVAAPTMLASNLTPDNRLTHSFRPKARAQLHQHAGLDSKRQSLSQHCVVARRSRSTAPTGSGSLTFTPVLLGITTQQCLRDVRLAFGNT